jgi:hypothetical protein
MFKPMMPQFVFSGYDSDGLVGGALNGGAGPDSEKFYLVASARIGPKVRVGPLVVNVGDFRQQRFEDVSHLSFAPLPLQLAFAAFKQALDSEPLAFRNMLTQVVPDTLIERYDNSLPGRGPPRAALGLGAANGQSANTGAVILVKAWKKVVGEAYSSTKRKPKGFDPSLQKGKANCRTGGKAEFCWDVKLTKKMRNPNVYHKREKDLFDRCREIMESNPRTEVERNKNVAELERLVNELRERRDALNQMQDFDVLEEEVAEEGGGGGQESGGEESGGEGDGGAAAARPRRVQPARAARRQ